MSQSYRFDIRISDLLNESERERAFEAVSHIWQVDEFDVSDGETLSSEITMSSSDTIYGGEGDEAVAKRIADSVWGALEREVPIRIDSTYLDMPPDDTYEFGPKYEGQ